MFGELVEFELKPGGADMDVTEENKQEYVQLMVEYRLLRNVKHEIVSCLSHHDCSFLFFDLFFTLFLVAQDPITC